MVETGPGSGEGVVLAHREQGGSREGEREAGLGGRPESSGGRRPGSSAGRREGEAGGSAGQQFVFEHYQGPNGARVRDGNGDVEMG